VQNLSRDVVVIRGGGHVGLPLAIALADRGLNVSIYDDSQSAVESINVGVMPSAEPGGEVVLRGNGTQLASCS